MVMTPSLIVERRVVLATRLWFAIPRLGPTASFLGLFVLGSFRSVYSVAGLDFSAAEGCGASAALAAFLAFSAAGVGSGCCHCTIVGGVMV